MDSLAEEAKRQREQLARYIDWVEMEGGIEGPTHLDTWFLPEQRDRLMWLKAHCEGNIMELGCNYGYVLAFCDGQIGVDWNEQSLKLAQILNPRKLFIKADIRSLPFGNDFVDTILVTDVLEHIPWDDLPKTVEGIMRVCRRKCLISLPNAEYLARHASIMKHRFLLTDAKFQEMVDFLLSHWRVHWERTYHWALFEVFKERDHGAA